MCDIPALLTILEQHGVSSYEDLGDSLIGEAAEQLRAALLASSSQLFVQALEDLYYSGYRGVPRGLPDEEQAKADNEWWRAHDNTVAVHVAARKSKELEQPRILRSAVRPKVTPAKAARKVANVSTVGKRQRPSPNVAATAHAEARRLLL